MNKNNLDLARAGAKSLPSRRALASLQRLRAELQALRMKGSDPQALERLERRGLDAIVEDLVADKQSERQRLKNRLQEMEAQYVRQRREKWPDIRIERETEAIRLSSLSTKELEKETEAFVVDPRAERDPAAVDLRIAELRKRGSNSADPLREIARKSAYDRPWLLTDEGREAGETLQLLEKIERKDSSMVIEARTSEGHLAGAVTSVAELWNDLQSEASDAAL